MKLMGSIILFLVLSFSTYSQEIKVKLLDYELTCEESSVEYYENDKLKKCKLIEEQKIQDLMCIGLIEFHKNEKIKSCILSFEQYVQNIPIKNGKETPLYLYANGKLKVFTLARTVYLFDDKYKKGTKIKMDLIGEVEIID